MRSANGSAAVPSLRWVATAVDDCSLLLSTACLFSLLISQVTLTWNANACSTRNCQEERRNVARVPSHSVNTATADAKQRSSTVPQCRSQVLVLLFRDLAFSSRRHYYAASLTRADHRHRCTRTREQNLTHTSREHTQERIVA